ncbi:MAG: phosphodiester glycosidase family protein [Cyanobacteria bacterium]|nr:phosphodiester glycosidase family protein [Cyanobacteriota bacterium]
MVVRPHDVAPTFAMLFQQATRIASAVSRRLPPRSAPAASQTPPPLPIEKKLIHAKHDLAKRHVEGNLSFDTLTVDILRTPIRLYRQDSSGGPLGSIEQLKQFVEESDHRLIFATNAGIFAPGLAPQGLYIEDGRELFPIDLGKPKKGDQSNFYRQPNGVFALSPTKAFVVESSRLKDLAGKTTITYATQSGPLLLVKGKINSSFNKTSTSRYIRSGVGIVDEHTVVFAISNELVNFHEFATLFAKLGCSDALYLDGAISRMYLPALERRDLDGNFSAMFAIVD